MTTTSTHPNTCLCVPCMTADMDAHLAAQGIDPAAYGAVEVAPERTRYATPGQRCGNGTVRKVSPAQVALIKRLMAERDTRNLVRLPGSEDVESMSLRGASDLIERLFECPMLPQVAAKLDAPSEKAVSYALSLAERKGVPTTADEIRSKGRRGVSDMIDMLKALSDRPTPMREAVAEGMYRDPATGDVFKVQRAVHGSGNLYAKRLIVEGGAGSFEYAAGAVNKIMPAWRMTLAQAKEFGALYGVCCVCSRTLTDEASIAAGIGPVCANKF